MFVPKETVRDYFAGQALTGIAPVWFKDWVAPNDGTHPRALDATCPESESECFQVVAEACYVLADAMLEARNEYK